MYRDNGIEVLKRELADSYARLNGVKRGKRLNEVVRAHQPSFYLPEKEQYDQAYRATMRRTCFSSWKAASPCVSSCLNRSVSSTRKKPCKTTYNTFKRGRRKRNISISQLEKSSVQFDDYRIPQKKDELRTTLSSLAATPAPNAGPPVAEISFSDSRPMAPYIKLLSLRDLAERADNDIKCHREASSGTKGGFDPMNLVATIDSELEKLIVNRRRKLQEQCKLLLPPGGSPQVRRGNRYSGGGRFSWLSAQAGGQRSPGFRAIIKKKVIPFVMVATKVEAKKSSPGKKPSESAAPKAKTNDYDLARSVLSACETYNKKKGELRTKLLSALDVQCNNRPNALAYKQNNLEVKGMSSKFELEIVRMRTKAERDRLQRFKECIKRDATRYYSLAHDIMSQGLDIPRDIHYIMDYYKSLIESGETLRPEHLTYMVENVYPSEAEDQVTRYLQFYKQNRVLSELARAAGISERAFVGMYKEFSSLSVH